MRWRHEGATCGATSRRTDDTTGAEPLRIETPPCPGTLHMRHPSGCSDHDLGYATCSVCNRVVQIRGSDMVGAPKPQPPPPPVQGSLFAAPVDDLPW